jgi:hypothetical protein
MAADLTTLLERLVAAEVEVVLVGGLAAVVQGAPITTFDVDVVHRRTEENALVSRVAAPNHRHSLADSKTGGPLSQTAGFD